MSLADVLTSAPADVAIHMNGVAVSRATLEREADALADALRAEGVAPGTVVAARLPNDPLLVAALFGVWRMGAVYAPLNPRAPSSEIEDNIDALQPAAVLMLAEDRRWSVRRPATASSGVARYDADVALLQFTSGTTGRPKPVPLRHSTVLDLIDGVLASIRSGASSTTDRAPMPNLVPVSLSLWAGIYQVLFAFRVGAPIVLMERFDTTTFAELVARFEIRSTVLPPAAMTMLSDDAAIVDLTPLRIVRSISAPLAPAQARRFHDRFGVMVLNGYGQTELGGEVVGWTAADSRAHGDAKLGSVGRPHDGVEVRVDDEGELLVRTRATAGRRIDVAFHDRLTSDGWFHTGDLGAIDDDGFVWIDGRVSDMINRGGLKVFPGQVEDVLLAAPDVCDAAVVGVADERLGEIPWAYVVAQAPIDEAALATWCRDRLSAYKVPARFVQVEALPRNEIGKLLRRDLAEDAAGAPRDATD